MMRVIPVLFASAAVGAGVVGAAVTLRPASVSIAAQGSHEQRPGPDSARVAMLLDALGRTFGAQYVAGWVNVEDGLVLYWLIAAAEKRAVYWQAPIDPAIETHT